LVGAYSFLATDPQVTISLTEEFLEFPHDLDL